MPVILEPEQFQGWLTGEAVYGTKKTLQKDVGCPQEVLPAYATRSGNSTFSCCWKMSANFSKPAFAG